MLYGIPQGKGFVQNRGGVGAGKRTRCRALLGQLGNNYSTALILNPILDADQLMRAIAVEFGLDVRGLDRLETLEEINLFLLRQVEENREAVLIIDEAQNLTNDLLEQVRLLSNLETDDRKLLQIVLMGQPELRDKLNDPRLRQLRQRITVRYHLTALSRKETEYYIRHRIHVSGGNGSPSFNRWALRKIFNYSKGTPRLINAVCDKTLLCGFVTHADQFKVGHVRRAINELEGNFK